MTRRGSRDDGLDVDFFGELPGCERWLLDTIVDTKRVVTGYCGL